MAQVNYVPGEKGSWVVEIKKEKFPSMESIPLAEQKTHEVLFRDWNINPPICMTYLLYWHTLQTTRRAFADCSLLLL